MRVALYKALQSTVSGTDIEARGLDAADDPDGYAGTPGTSGKGEAPGLSDALGTEFWWGVITTTP